MKAREEGWKNILEDSDVSSVDFGKDMVSHVLARTLLDVGETLTEDLGLNCAVPSQV